MEPLRLVQGDTSKPIEADLTDEDGVVTLIGVQVIFRMAQQDGVKTLEAIGEADSGTNVVRYWPLEADVSRAGIFHGEFTVIFGNGKEETFPSDEPIEIIIRSRVS